jgi:hypothetical protein
MIKSDEEVEVGLVLTLSSHRTIIIPNATE